MLGKTHMAVGIASALLLAPAKSIPDLMLGCGAAAVGSIISDIDVGTSSSHKDADKAIGMAVVSVALVAVADMVLHLGVYDTLMENNDAFVLLYSAALFLALCAYGMRKPHRTYMHSYLALFSLGACVNIFAPPAMPFFMVAFFSHMAIDLLNTKGVQLFYPLKKKYCLKKCSSKGKVNEWLFKIAVPLSGLLFVVRALMLAMTL